MGESSLDSFLYSLTYFLVAGEVLRYTGEVRLFGARWWSVSPIEIVMVLL
jgi:hypothetical protein